MFSVLTVLVLVSLREEEGELKEVRRKFILILLGSYQNISDSVFFVRLSEACCWKLL